MGMVQSAVVARMCALIAVLGLVSLALSLHASAQSVGEAKKRESDERFEYIRDHVRAGKVVR
jgi:hypothetical protein